MLMTVEQLLAFPENDAIDRELINGRLRERPAMPHDRRHSRSTACLCGALGNWMASNVEQGGEVLVGGSFHLRRHPDTAVGIDIACISRQTARANSEDATLIEGVPVLVIEILSPTDQQEDILDKVQLYLDCGVPLVWVAEPVFRTITVYRPGRPPEFLNDTQEIDGGAHLTGFRAKVADCF